MIATIVTRGYGSSGSIAGVASAGYIGGSSSATAEALQRSQGGSRASAMTFLETVQLRLQESIDAPIDTTVAVRAGQSSGRTIGLMQRLGQEASTGTVTSRPGRSHGRTLGVGRRLGQS